MIESLGAGLSAFFAFIPHLIGAFLILIIGYIVAKIVQALLAQILQAIGFDAWMERGSIKQFFDRTQTRQTPATVLGKLVFWFVFIIAITMATDALGIQQVSQVLAQLIAYIPSIIIAAILILILAALLANFLSGIVRGATGSEILASIARYAIIIYARGLRRPHRAGHRGGAYGSYFPHHPRSFGPGGGHSAFGLGAQNVAREIVERAYQRRSELTSGSRGTREFGHR